MSPEAMKIAVHCVANWVKLKYGNIIGIKAEATVKDESEAEVTETSGDFDCLQKNSSFFNSNILEQYEQMKKVKEESAHSSRKQASSRYPKKGNINTNSIFLSIA